MTLWHRMLLWSSPTSYQQQSVTGCISERTAAEEKWNDKTFTSFIRLCRGCFLSFSISAFTSLASTLEGQGVKHLFLSKSFILHKSLRTSSWAVFAFAGSVAVLKWDPAREGHSGIQGQGETEILLCHLTKREGSSMSQAESCGGGTSE